MTAKLEKWTGWLLVFLALGAFVLSFAGMYAVAIDAGYGWLAWLWPLVTAFDVARAASFGRCP